MIKNVIVSENNEFQVYNQENFELKNDTNSLFGF